MDREEFRKNSPDRCYYCKKISAQYLKQRADELGFACIADGINVSDTYEHRPGLAASNEEGIVHPFIETGITKQDIRDIAQACGLPIWQKPSGAWLSSRIPYGEEITLDKLRMIEKAESFLSGKGFSQLRGLQWPGCPYRIAARGITGGNTFNPKRSCKKSQVNRIFLCYPRS